VGLAFPAPGSEVRIDRIARDTFSRYGKAVAAGEDDPSPLEFVCCGRPLPGHQIRVVDEQDRELPERQEGRLQFKGPSSTGGYFRNAEETRGLFHGEWLDSGDLAYSAEGEIYLTGRKKDIIIRGGRNIYPHELEEAIGEIPGIRKGSTAVFASGKGHDSSEKLVVLTETRQRREETLRELKKSIDGVAIDLVGAAADEVVITPPGTVLKTSSGKIRRSACRQLYESGHIGRRKPAVWLQLARMALAGVGPMMRRVFARVASLLYASYCWLILCLLGAGAWCGLMVLPAGRRCWQLAAVAVRLLCRLTGIGVTTSGLENIPVDERYLLVSNHMSYLDSILLTGVLPRHANYVAKAELAENPFLLAALKKLEVLLVDRFDAEKGVADSKKIAEGLRKGMRPLFFAEGTVQRMPGLLPFQMGAFLLASEEGVAVVPVVITGTRGILRAGSWFPRHGRVQVVFGQPCLPTATGWQGAIELRDRVRKEIVQRLGEPDLAGEFTSLSQMDIKRPIEKNKDRPSR
jgi:1-acyl-sn-glycerol-3-phosphate acyltransferase